MANPIVFTKTLAAASATNIAASQAASAGTPLTLNGAAVVNGVAIIDTYNAATNSSPGRRVLITSTSATETAVVTITGTNANGQTITETDTFSGSSTTLSSNLDYVTVTKIVPSGTIVGSLSAGTSAVGSSSWVNISYQSDSPTNIGACVELVSGSVTYTFDYTYDDPNNLPVGVTTPIVFNVSGLAGATAGSPKDSLLANPIAATRVSISAGTGTLRVRQIQAGIG